MFMQIILESAGVLVIISTPNAVPITHQLQMDARAKALMVHGMSTAVIPQLLTMRSTTQQLWGDIRLRFGQLSTVKLARLEEDLERLSILASDDIVVKLGDFTRIKNLLEEFGSRVSNPVHKLLGKLLGKLPLNISRTPSIFVNPSLLLKKL